jgi:predicted nucleotide-binding protein
VNFEPSADCPQPASPVAPLEGAGAALIAWLRPSRPVIALELAGPHSAGAECYVRGSPKIRRAAFRFDGSFHSLDGIVEFRQWAKGTAPHAHIELPRKAAANLRAQPDDNRKQRGRRRLASRALGVPGNTNPMRTDEHALLEHLKARLDDSSASMAGVVQDALTLAKIKREGEWYVYFALQLTGVVGIENPQDLKNRPWGKNVEFGSFTWEPGQLFLSDRKSLSGASNGSSLESLELMIKDLNEVESKGVSQYVPLQVELEHMVAQLRTRVRQFISELQANPLEMENSSRNSAPSRDLIAGRSILIGHGHSPAWRDLAGFLRDRLGLPYEEFNRLPTAGRTTVARLSEMLNNSCFALLILTAEDEDAEGRLQARLNVVHELGLSQGKFGFERAIVLLEDGCAEFSNIMGLGQIRFPRGNILAKSEDIRQVLEREGLVESR